MAPSQHAQTPRILSALAALVPFGFLARFIALPLADKLSYVPDDAFYYLQLGREWAATGRWSFDGGRTTTTGFHLLFAYLCALLSRIGIHDANRLTCVHATIAVILTALSIGLLNAVARRLFPKGASFALLTVGFASGMSILPFQGMEWPFVVFAGALAAFAFATDRRWLLAASFLVGPFCRSDFILLGGTLALAHASLDLRLREKRTRKALLFTLVPTFAGGALISLHTWMVDGHFVQASARMKAHWGNVVGFSLGYGADPVSFVFTPAGLFTRVLDYGTITLLVPAALLGVAFVVRDKSPMPERSEVGWRWAVIATVGYICFYSKVANAAMPWYSANFAMPMFLLSARLAHTASHRVRRFIWWPLVALAVGSIWFARRPMWNAKGMYESITQLRDSANPPPVIASWNAGTIGYLSGIPTVNIDGLVNDDVIPYIVADRVHCYLVHESIDHIFDLPHWADPVIGRYLGFSDGKLLRALTRDEARSSFLTLWRVDLPALAADPLCVEDLRSSESRTRRPYRH